MSSKCNASWRARARACGRTCCAQKRLRRKVWSVVVEKAICPSRRLGYHARRAMENKLPGEQELRVITDTMPVAAVRCDREGRFLWVNQTYAKWAGRSPRELIGMRVVDIAGSRAMREVQPFIDRVLAGEPISYERVVELPGIGRH